MIAERYITEEKVSVQIYGQGVQLDAVLRNLSQTGAGLEILTPRTPLQKGDLLSLTIELQSLSKTHNVDAEVVWTQGQGVGVAFMKQNEIFDRMLQKNQD